MNKKYYSYIERFKKGEKGMALILALIFMLLGMLLITPLLSYMATNLKTGAMYTDKSNDLYSADAGIQDAVYRIKNNHLNTLTPTYNEYDYITEWNYDVDEQVNGQAVNVTIKNLWAPTNITAPSKTTANSIVNAEKLMVTGSSDADNGTYTIIITYDMEAYDNTLTVDSIGVWLPPGFSYDDSRTGTLDDDPYQTYYSEPEPIAHQGSWAVVWEFSDIDFISLPGVSTSDDPMVAEITFPFTPEKTPSNPPVAADKPSAIAWITTGGVSDIPYAWDIDIKLFKIESESGGTTIESYIAKNELRQMSTAFNGQYYATGNTLMRDAIYDSGYIRDTWMNDVSGATNSSSTTVEDIPETADIVAAYLYWTGWKEEASKQGVSPLNPDTCTDFTNWDNGSAWSVYSTSYFRGHYSSGTDSERVLELKDHSLDLSASGLYSISWDQWLESSSTMDPLSPDTCSTLDNWTRSGTDFGTDTYWTTSSGRFQGHGGDTEDYKLLTLTDSIDLSSFSSGSVTISWNQYINSAPLSSSDGLDVAFSSDGGTTWSSYVQALRGPATRHGHNYEITSFYSYTIPDSYLTTDFKVRIRLVGFADNNEYIYLDNIAINVPAPSYSEDDGLDFAFSSDGGTTWSNYIEAFRGDIGYSAQEYSYIIPEQYLTNNFKVKFNLIGFNDSREYACLDDIKVSACYPDESILFKINDQQVYYDASGNPVAGASDLTSSSSDVILNITNNTNCGFSYACFRDVTTLVTTFGDKAEDPATNIPGNDKYTVGNVDATLGENGNNAEVHQLAHAGWSLILIYSDPDSPGHQLYLFDRFTFADDQVNLDFDNDGDPGGYISGFVVPPRVEENGVWETNAASITCFAGEGDNWITGDFIALNAPSSYWSNSTVASTPNSYKLWDGQSTATNNTSTAPNNVWNGLSSECTADGIDVDTFDIPWDSDGNSVINSDDLISEGDTSAFISIYTNSDNWNLVYIIISFRSLTTTGGSLSYLIHG